LIYGLLEVPAIVWDENGMTKLAIVTGSVELIVQTRDTETARQILAVLPIQARTMTWGEEVYFPVPVNAGREADAKDVIEPGEIAFWIQGHSIAIGFGRTPLSRGNEIRLAASCNIWADALGDVRQLGIIEDGEPIAVTRLT
jgi:uncharacterized protein